MPTSSKLTDKLSLLFSKAESTDHLGVSLQQGCIGYCQISKTQPANLNSIELGAKNYPKLLYSLTNEHQLSGQCHLVLAAELYQIVQIDKPNVPASEMLGALKWQVKDQVTFSPEDMTLDYFDGPTLAGGAEKLNVVCTASSVLKTFVTPLLNDQIQLKTITTPEFAFANLLPVQNDACLLVCQQPNEEILLLIVKNGQLFFQRRLRGFSRIADSSELELTMGIIDTLSLEIQRSTDYFERQLKQAAIKSIQLILPISTESYLTEKLAENTNIPVKILTLPTGFENFRHLATSISASMMVTGLPLEQSMNKLNDQSSDKTDNGMEESV